MPKKTASKSNRTGTKKATKTEKGERYYCEVCGCEVACIQPSEGTIVCCDEPMLLVCE